MHIAHSNLHAVLHNTATEVYQYWDRIQLLLHPLEQCKAFEQIYFFVRPNPRCKLSFHISLTPVMSMELPQLWHHAEPAPQMKFFVTAAVFLVLSSYCFASDFQISYLFIIRLCVYVCIYLFTRTF